MFAWLCICVWEGGVEETPPDLCARDMFHLPCGSNKACGLLLVPCVLVPWLGSLMWTTLAVASEDLVHDFLSGIHTDAVQPGGVEPQRAV